MEFLIGFVVGAAAMLAVAIWKPAWVVWAAGLIGNAPKPPVPPVP